MNYHIGHQKVAWRRDILQPFSVAVAYYGFIVGGGLERKNTIA